ncbi:hypothetical protein G9H62_06445 [Aquirufa ecclesiirivi]|uniref:hypothetical protein n=1 Tax=Aquirufa ecclesiirivi TaxID=2715124 RepID=UPI0022A8C18E|nr:hypothetical protein [Aquirufa ecclesiirivi]MCZ2472470.1 hypothetical protein [Aquirufa ecclesiirivi]
MKRIITLVFLTINVLAYGQIDSTKNSGIEFKNELNWDTIIALSVSIVSIVFTYIQVRIQRTHNKKTVKPIGRIRIGDYQNNIFVKVENNGVGPLIIKQILIKRDTLQTTKSLIDILPNDLTKRITWTNFTGSYEGRTIIPGQSLELIVWTINSSYEGKSNDIIENDRNDLRKALKEISVSVTYTDIYEKEEFMHDLSREEFSSWYGRHEQ